MNLVIFQALFLSTYVDSMYLVRVTPPMNSTFSDNSLFLKKIFLAGDINSLNRPYLESAFFQMCMILTLVLVSFERK